MREYLDFEKPIAEIEEKIEKLAAAGQSRPGVQDDLRKLRAKLYQLQAEIYARLTPWQRTQVARHPQRPSTVDYIGRICDSFLELPGDRLYGDPLGRSDEDAGRGRGAEDDRRGPAAPRCDRRDPARAARSGPPGPDRHMRRREEGRRGPPQRAARAPARRTPPTAL